MLRTRALDQSQHSGGGHLNNGNNAAHNSTVARVSHGISPGTQTHPHQQTSSSSRSTATQLSHYQMLEKVGDGTFGTVILALDKTMGNNTRIALKKMKTEYRNKDEGDREREVRTLRRLRHHKNIIRLYATFFENGVFYIAYEFMERNLLDLIRGVHNHQQQQSQRSQQQQQAGLSEHDVRLIMFQVFAGIDHLHRHGYFHRDMKPENILCNGAEVVKICDFGLAKEVRSAPPFTTYISTRWYRAPELLLSALNYNTPIDIWACGCIMFECYTGNPLFPGKTDIDMIHKICARLGDPKESEWPDGHKLIKKKSLKFPVCTPVNFALLFNEGGAGGVNDSGSSSSFVSNDAITLMRNILRWNPIKRIGASQILRHAFFASVPAALKNTHSSDAAVNGLSADTGTPTSGGGPTSRTPTAARQQNNNNRASDNNTLTTKSVAAAAASRASSGVTGNAAASNTFSGKKTSVVGGSKRTSYNIPHTQHDNAAVSNGSSVLPSSGRPASPPESSSGVDNNNNVIRQQQQHKAAPHASKSGGGQLPSEKEIQAHATSISANNSIAAAVRKSDSLNAFKTSSNKQRSFGDNNNTANDIIYEYATSSNDADGLIAAAAAAAAASHRPPSPTHAGVGRAGSPAASSGSGQLVDNNNNSRTGRAANAGDKKAVNNNNNNSNKNAKLLNDLFRDIDALSDNNTDELRRRRRAAQPSHQPASPVAENHFSPTLLERSKTTSPPKLLSHQRRNDYEQQQHLYDKLFVGDADISNNPNKKFSGASHSAVVPHSQRNGGGGKFSLDELVSMTAPSSTSVSKLTAGSLYSRNNINNNNNRYAADLYGGVPSLSLDGKRVALKKSSTEFSLRKVPHFGGASSSSDSRQVPVNNNPPVDNEQFVSVNTSSFLPPVTSDPLATLNDMLYVGASSGGGGTVLKTAAKTSTSDNAAAVINNNNNGGAFLLNAKHSTSSSGFDSIGSRKKVDLNNNNSQNATSHLTDWSRKYPQWK